MNLPFLLLLPRTRPGNRPRFIIVSKAACAAVLFLAVCLLPRDGRAICKPEWGPELTDMIGRINWHCLFPVRLAGVRIDPYRNADDEVDQEEVLDAFGESLDRYRSASATPVTGENQVHGFFCQCDTAGLGGYYTGVRVSFWEPVRVVEVIHDAWCFPFLMMDMKGDMDTENASMATRIQKDGSLRVSHEGRTRTAFWQAHYYVFPVLAILEVLTDFICMDTSGFDLGYITEVDPRWDDPELSAVLNPETILFANPVAVLACIPDVMAATIKSTIDSLYWCQGSWDTVFPLGGYINHTNYIESEAAAMGRVIFQLHRNFVLWGTVGEDALCQRYPMPIWRKSQYRWQLMWPKRDNKCRVIGEPGFLWSADKDPMSPSANMSNFVNLLWRKRMCCAR